jgi:hypothetical protein
LDVKALESKLDCFASFYHISYINSQQAAHFESEGFQAKAGQANTDGAGMQLERLQAYSKRCYMYRATVSVQFHVYIHIPYWLGTSLDQYRRVFFCLIEEDYNDNGGNDILSALYHNFNIARHIL